MINKTILSVLIIFVCMVSSGQTAWDRQTHKFTQEISKGPLRLKSVEVKTNPKGELAVRSQFSSNSTKFITRSYSLWLGDEKVWQTSTCGHGEIRTKIDPCKLWTADEPSVYKLQISKGENDTINVPVIFRNINVINGQLMVNATRVKVKAFKAKTVSEQELKFAKEYGFNTVITDRIGKKTVTLCQDLGYYLIKSGKSVEDPFACNLSDFVKYNESDKLEKAYANRTVISTYDKQTGALEIENTSMLSGMKLVAEIKQGADIVHTRLFDLEDLVPMSKVTRLIEIDYFPQWKDTYLDLAYYHDNALVLKDQIIVDTKAHHRMPKGGLVRIDDMEGHFVYSGIQPYSDRVWELRIDKTSGFIDSYVVAGNQMIASPIHPVGWTLSDITSVLLNNDGSVIVCSPKGRLVYSTSGDGTVYLNLYDSPCDSFCGAMPGSFESTEYYGRGPQNCYGKGNRYGYIGRYMQKAGWNHSDMKWFSVFDNTKEGIVFGSDYDFMAMTELNQSGTGFSFTSMYGMTEFYFYPYQK